MEKERKYLNYLSKCNMKDYYLMKKTITDVSNACSHSGLVQEALDIFYNLEHKLNIKSNIIYCTSIVDVLGRAVRLEDAENFITQ
jgi:hypothetical protein